MQCGFMAETINAVFIIRRLYEEYNVKGKEVSCGRSLMIKWGVNKYLCCYLFFYSLGR